MGLPGVPRSASSSPRPPVGSVTRETPGNRRVVPRIVDPLEVNPSAMRSVDLEQTVASAIAVIPVRRAGIVSGLSVGNAQRHSTSVTVSKPRRNDLLDRDFLRGGQTAVVICICATSKNTGDNENGDNRLHKRFSF